MKQLCEMLEKATRTFCWNFCLVRCDKSCCLAQWPQIPSSPVWWYRFLPLNQLWELWPSLEWRAPREPWDSAEWPRSSCQPFSQQTETRWKREGWSSVLSCCRFRFWKRSLASSFLYLVFPPFISTSLYELYLITPLDGFLKHVVLMFL